MKHSQLRRRGRGFTLIELLVVITIVAVLVVGAFAAFGFVMDNAKRTGARNNCMAVYNAIDQYWKEYDYLPEPTSATKSTDCKSDTSAPEGLIWILIGKDETQNSRRQNFLGDINEAKSGSDNKKLDGLVRTEDSAELVDPWGSYYKVIIDLDLNDKIDNPNQDEANKGTPEIHKKSLVYSVGKDLKDESDVDWKDNVSSWNSK